MTAAASAAWSDFLLLTLCAAADHLDRAADAASLEIADLPLLHRGLHRARLGGLG